MTAELAPRIHCVRPKLVMHFQVDDADWKIVLILYVRPCFWKLREIRVECLREWFCVHFSFDETAGVPVTEFIGRDFNDRNIRVLCIVKISWSALIHDYNGKGHLR